MSKKLKLNPIAAVAGSAVVATALTSLPVQADTNPFASIELSNGFQLAAHHAEGKCGEGKCGEGKCGEGKAKKSGEGKCGEGKCGGE